MDQFSRSCVLLLIVLLAVIALRPVFSPQSAEAAHHYKYVVATVQNEHEIGKPCPLCSPQGVLDKYSAEVWELFTATSPTEFIFRK